MSEGIQCRSTDLSMGVGGGADPSSKGKEN